MMDGSGGHGWTETLTLNDKTYIAETWWDCGVKRGMVVLMVSAQQ